MASSRGSKIATARVPPRGSRKTSRPGARPASPTPPARGQQAAFQARKRQQRLITTTAIAVVILIVLVLVVVKVAGGGTGKKPVSTGSSASPANLGILQSIEQVPLSTLATAAQTIRLSSYPQPTSAGAVAGSAGLSSGGRPEVFYLGAEYCPFCAGERWAMVMALSHFGTFTNLGQVTSSPTDSTASIPTFSFHGSSYSSPYLDFSPVETENVDGATLQVPTAEQTSLVNRYDSRGDIPFLDLGGKWYQVGINYDDTSLQHVSHAAVAQQIAQQSTATGQAIAATAGVLTSMICNLTGGHSLDNACAVFPKAITK